jgi:hypothetical protein
VDYEWGLPGIERIQPIKNSLSWILGSRKDFVRMESSFLIVESHEIGESTPNIDAYTHVPLAEIDKMRILMR